MADNLGALPIESIQAQLATVNDQTAQFKQAVDSAAGERADLSARLEALQASGLTQEDLSSLSQNIAGQRQADIAAALDPIAQQRQTAITSAIDPIQQQIEALRGEIPQQQNIDVEALRQQITDQVMSQLPQQQTTAPAETTTPPITVEPEGDASAAAMNLSDGQADALGLFDDPAPTGGSLRARGQLGYQRRDQFDPRGQQQFNQTPGVRDTVAVPTMRSNQMTGRSWSVHTRHAGYYARHQRKRDRTVMAKDNVPKNVANPALYRKAKAKAKRKFDVFPSAYASGYLVQEYKRMGGKYKGANGGEVTLDPQKSDLDRDGKLSNYERKRGTAIAKSMAKQAKGMRNGGTVMVQSRGCGAIMPEKQKMTRVPRG